MALPVTDQLITQMMTENVRTIPTTEMEGNVTRPLIISDLIKAQKDINFKQLMNEYGSMAGLPSEDNTPLTRGLMKESPKVPETPLEQSQAIPQQEEQIEVPKPMTQAMAMNTLAPTDTVELPEKKEETGLMSNATQQIA
jgi:hypothetical protein